MANTWFVCIDPADKNVSTARKEQVDFRIQVQPSDPNYKTLMSGGVINWNGQPLIKWKGPFATEAQAKAAQNPKQQSPNPASDLITAGQNSSNPFFSIPASIGNFFTTIAQRETWVRIAEFLIGGGLIYIGINSMAKGTPLQGVVEAPKNVAKTAVKSTPVGRTVSKATKVAKGK